ncbi:MAG: DUF3794 domain-containing protein [Clostridiales bacterium]|nr:DUF3794 domain-containing protein [Clostridiales bacterium]
MQDNTSTPVSLYSQCIRQSKQIAIEITGILPDSKPRIHQIEDTAFFHTLSAISCDNNVAQFTASLSASVLYTGVSTWGGEEAMNTASFDMEKSLHETVEYEGEEKDVRLISLDLAMDSIECTALTPRKISVKAYATVNAVFAPITSYNVISHVGDNVCTLDTALNITQPVASFKTQTFVKEDIALPQGVGSLRRILRKRILPVSQSVKTEGSRGIIYSAAEIHVVYERDEEPATVSAFKVSVDYNHAIELPLDEDRLTTADISITQDVGDIYAEVKEGGILSVEFVVGYDTKIYEAQHHSFPCDAFSLTGEDTVTCNSISPAEIFTVCNPIGACSEKLYPKEGTLGQILDCEVKPLYVTGTPHQGGITVEGVYSVKAIYTLKDNPLCIGAVSSEIPFSYFCECKCGSVLNTGIDVSSICAEASQFGDVSVKWSVCVRALCQSVINTGYISDITPCNDTPVRERCIYCYNKSKDEGLWDVAKKFKVSPSDICSINSKSSEEIDKSELRLIIIKSV